MDKVAVTHAPRARKASLAGVMALAMLAQGGELAQARRQAANAKRQQRLRDRYQGYGFYPSSKHKASRPVCPGCHQRRKRRRVAVEGRKVKRWTCACFPHGI